MLQSDRVGDAVITVDLHQTNVEWSFSTGQ